MASGMDQGCVRVRTEVVNQVAIDRARLSIPVLKSGIQLFTVFVALAIATVGATAGATGGAQIGTEKAEGSKSRAEYSRIGDSAHFEFEGSDTLKYKLSKGDRENGSTEVRLLIPKLDEASQKRLEAVKDSSVRIESIQDLSAVQSEVVFVVSKQADFFDYVSERPQRLIVDFFPRFEATQDTSASTTRSDEKATVKKANTLPAKLSQKTKSSKAPLQDRAPAGGDFILVAKEGPDGVRLVPELTPLAEKVASRKDFERGIFDGGDPEFRRFTVKDYEIKRDAKIDAAAQLRIPFPMLDLGFTQLKFILDNPAEYAIDARDDDENKEARLLLTLFKNNRPAILLKTAADFLKQYPKSEYDEIIRYLMADTHYALWQKERAHIEENKIKDAKKLHDTDFEEAMGIYSYLIEKYPDSKLNARTLLLVGYSYLERGDSLGAMKTFQKFVRMQPNSGFGGQVKISIARAFLALNRFEDALKELDQVVKDAPQVTDQDEAAFRRGDVYFRWEKYPEAIKAYEEAMASRTAAAARFPNASYNLAEAHFRLNNELEAINAYRGFLQKFPEHRYGGFAMTRLGELIESLVGSEDKRVTGAFFESYFRYRSTPGADIARVRVLASRIPDMKDREFKDAVREIDDIVKRQSDLPAINEFRVITISDAFTKRGEYDRATDDLIRFYKENTQSRKLDLVRGRIVRNMIEGIKKSVEKQDFFEALRRYSKDEEGWLKGAQRADLPYLVGRAYEIAGAPQSAQAAFEKAATVIANRTAGQREPFEMSLSQDDLNLRIAKALYESDQPVVAEKKMKEIKPQGLSSSERWEYTKLAAELAESRGDRALAIRVLKEAVEDKDLKLKSEDRFSVGFKLAQMYEKEKQYVDADEALESALKTDALSRSLTLQGLEKRAQILIQMKKTGQAISNLKAALEIADQDVSPKARSLRYLKGKLEFEKGDIKDAEQTWGQLNQGPQDLLSKMAAEQMRSAQWTTEYKKYLQRIPASESLR